MTCVKALPATELRRRLDSGLFRLRTGPFVSSIRTSLSSVQEGLARLYAEHRVESDMTFTDFVIGVDRPAGLRRWIKPQVVFTFDGDRPFAPLPGDQGFALFEWGMNWCVHTHCHQYLILHAAVLERDGRALVLPAPSGSGKSTLCAGLAFNGWRLLSDELTVIDPGRLVVLPVPRPISLKNTSIDVIRQFVPEAVMSEVVHDTTKGSVAHCKPAADAIAREQEVAHPAWLVIPRYQKGTEAKLQPMPKARAMMKAVDSTFNFNVQRRGGFESLGRLVDRCACFEFTYSHLEEAVAVFAELAQAPMLARA